MISFEERCLEITSEIESNYEIGAKLYEVNFPEAIYCGVLIFPSSEHLNRFWRKVNSSISISLSEKFKNDFQKWNFYLIYSCEFDIDRKTKYMIENDKSFSRKITINNSELDSREIKNVIEEDILFTDIGFRIDEIETKYDNDEPYKSELFDLIPSGNLNTEDLKKVFNKVCEMLEKKNEA
ncbi:hypothetical protein FB440_10891 [Vibrio crassostreae]|uniref:ABC-three component system middle component 1 n=1 Tax=Vibrio crassostreae TaxID=246167 RepID=UPI00119C24D3|nr:ABC-three component system middle component 1 [Vibrio crassostreae]TWD37955.1 hypothetical protein FB440_10891 [Vibrio crassostreae]